MNLSSRSDANPSRPPTPRRSGLTPLDLVLMGKGLAHGRRLMSPKQADAFADRRGRAVA